MKTGLIVALVGLLVSVFGLYAKIGDGLGQGYLVIFVGYPLILIGLVIVIYKFIKSKKQQ